MHFFKYLTNQKKFNNEGNNKNLSRVYNSSFKTKLKKIQLLV
jgi:hypothetical protein